MRLLHIAAFAACGVLLSGCLTTEETVLSTNQKVAMVYSPGDSISPPANLVLLANRNGQYYPVATGFGQAPIPAALNGAVAGAAVGAGIYGGAKVAKPPTTNVTAVGNNNVSNTPTNTNNPTNTNTTSASTATTVTSGNQSLTATLSNQQQQQQQQQSSITSTVTSSPTVSSTVSVTASPTATNTTTVSVGP
jgi:hypothetical protein